MMKNTFTAIVSGFSLLTMVACSDKNAEILSQQAEILNENLRNEATDNPDLIVSATANYADAAINVDIKLADSLFMTSVITEPLFEYFTACEVKNHIDKNLETTVNALSAKDENVKITLTDVYGDSREYVYSAATLKRMVKTPLTQLNFNDARQALVAALTASEEQFRPVGAKVKSVETSYNKTGFIDYTVTFENASYFKPLTVANLKFRAIETLSKRYNHLGDEQSVIFAMYKSLGIDGFHLIYTAGENTPSLKCTVLLSDLK